MLASFLLWQAAYSEYYFCDALWPLFRHIDFLRAIRSYRAASGVSATDSKSPRALSRGTYP